MSEFNKSKFDDAMTLYTTGQIDYEEANAAFSAAGSDVFLDPDNDILTEEEINGTTLGNNAPYTINGYGMMDHGFQLEKVHVVNGKTPDINMGAERAYVYIAGERYQLFGDELGEVQPATENGKNLPTLEEAMARNMEKAGKTERVQTKDGLYEITWKPDGYCSGAKKV